MANVTQKVEQIRQAKCGEEVRESMASGIEAMNTETISTTAKQTALEITFKDLIINAGSSNAEIVAARGGEVDIDTRLNKSATQIEDIVKQPVGADKTGVNDSTTTLQAKINALTDGDTLWIRGIYKVSQLNLTGKKNIKIDGNGTIIQSLPLSEIGTCSMEHPCSFKALLSIDDCDDVTIGKVTLNPIHEAIYVVNSRDTLIHKTKIDGKHTSKFSGIFINSDDVTVSRCSIKNCGTLPVWDGTKNPYAYCHGVAGSVCSNIKILNCNIRGNGENGVYTFACSHVTVKGNDIVGNGMSGIQFAFASPNLVTYTHYKVLNNIIEDNYSDGLDINNTTNIIVDAHVIIKGNHFKHNGFMGNNKTQDGSGIATLTYVKNIIIEDNDCYDSNRFGLYMNICENVRVGINNVDNVNGTGGGILIENSSNILLNGININTIGEGIKIYGTLKDITITNCKVVTDGLSLVLPSTNTIYDNIKIDNNTFIGNGNVNGVINMSNCYIESKDLVGLDVLKNDLHLSKCTFKGGSVGLQIRSIKNIMVDNCKMIGINNSGIYISGTSSNTVVNMCDISTLSGSPAFHVLETADNTRFTNNRITASTGNSIRLEPTIGNIFDDNNEIIGLYEKNGKTIKQLQWV